MQRQRQIGEWPTKAEIDAYMIGFKARVMLAKQKLNQNPKLLTNIAHPFIDGQTLRDYVTFIMYQGGLIGEAKACIYIEEN